ncbi:hypothetical protein JCM11251_005451 [Rhodosporidiobolus azoricus]
MSTTAQIVTGYRPPLATGQATTTTAAAVAGTGISWASRYTPTGTAASLSYTGTVTTSAQIVDSTGGVDSSSLLEYFTKPYLDAHTLSIPTWRYAYILWIAIAGTLVLWSLIYHLSGSGSRTGGNAVGAWFRKWSIRRITWTKRVGGAGAAEKGVGGVGGAGEGETTRKKVVFASPTFAQIIAVLVLVGLALCVSFIGDDYIAPTTCTFGGECPYQAYYGASGPPKSTYRAKRALPALRFPSFGSSSPSSFDTPSSSLVDNEALVAPPPTPVEGLTFHQLDKRGVNNPNGWAPFNDPLLASSNANIAANAWSAAARLGLISYAMLPLAVTLALKQWPFNIWASPFLTNYHFDKTAILHRWSGRVIWAFSTGHAIGWFWQLAHDKDPFGRMVLVPIWAWYRFCAGAVAWVLLTILTAFSFKPIRTRFYELFYWSHVLLVILFLVACIIHHAPLLWWPLIALVWWGAERFVRFVTFLWINGIVEGIWGRPPKPSRFPRSSGGFEAVPVKEKQEGGFEEVKFGSISQGGQSDYPPLPYDDPQEPLHGPSVPGMSRQGSFTNQALYPPASPSFTLAPSTLALSASTSSTSPRQLPPPGFASAQLLPGRTIRLTLHVPHTIRWKPGQHLLLHVPAVRFLDSHPYTIACVDERADQQGNRKKRGSEVVLLIRAQKGFSKALWDYVLRQRRLLPSSSFSTSATTPGVTLRTLVSLPMGSSGRVHWGAYETLVIICGGTGITFGVGVLEEACRKIAAVARGEMGEKERAKWRTKRVRFVWILREFAHLSWVASTLRRCIEMCDPSQLQVDLFVTHDAPKRPSRRRRQQSSAYPAHPAVVDSTDDLAPPSAPFARAGGRSGSPMGSDSIGSDLSDFSGDEGGSPTSSRYQLNQMAGGEAGEEVESVTDYVLFEGEEDHRTPEEAEMSAKLKKEGKLRRALSRRGVEKKGSLRRPGPQQPRRMPSLQPQQQYPSPFADSTASFEALPLDHSDHEQDLSSSPYPDPYARPRPSASYGDLGAHVRAPSAATSFAEYPAYDDRSDAGTLVGQGYGSGGAAKGMYGLHSVGGDGSSVRDLIKHAASPAVGGGSSSNRNSLSADMPDGVEDAGFFLDVTQAEMDALDAVAELAKTGYPRLKEIVHEEVERSSGKTVVACCGPSSLNTVVRNLVAKKIDLKRVAKGDPRGQVNLVVEDFTN